jgi:hypothetical protein
MTKNSRPAAADQTDAQTPAPTTSEQAGDPPAGNAAGAGEDLVHGRALIDLPLHGLRCGDFGEIPAAAAQQLTREGQFDPAAVAEATQD